MLSTAARFWVILAIDREGGVVGYWLHSSPAWQSELLAPHSLLRSSGYVRLLSGDDLPCMALFRWHARLGWACIIITAVSSSLLLGSRRARNAYSRVARVLRGLLLFGIVSTALLLAFRASTCEVVNRHAYSVGLTWRVPSISPSRCYETEGGKLPQSKPWDELPFSRGHYLALVDDLWALTVFASAASLALFVVFQRRKKATTDPTSRHGPDATPTPRDVQSGLPPQQRGPHPSK